MHITVHYKNRILIDGIESEEYKASDISVYLNGKLTCCAEADTDKGYIVTATIDYSEFGDKVWVDPCVIFGDVSIEMHH